MRGEPQAGQRGPVSKGVIQSRQRLGMAQWMWLDLAAVYTSGAEKNMQDDFMGAKIALFVGDRLLCLHRDDDPKITWPGAWDLPGGGREPGETPLDCVRRETEEEFSLQVPAAQIRWGRRYINSIGRTVWYFAGWMPPASERDIRLGDEGQGWALMTPADFLAHPKAVPQLQARLIDFQNGVAREAFS